MNQDQIGSDLRVTFTVSPPGEGCDTLFDKSAEAEADFPRQHLGCTGYVTATERTRVWVVMYLHGAAVRVLQMHFGCECSTDRGVARGKDGGPEGAGPRWVGCWGDVP